MSGTRCMQVVLVAAALAAAATASAQTVRPPPDLGAVLAGQKKFEEAEVRLLSGHDHLAGLEPANLGSDIRAILEEETGQRLVQLYLDWGKPEQAAEWRTKTTATGPRNAR